jgi:hypothetical protein
VLQDRGGSHHEGAQVTHLDKPSVLVGFCVGLLLMYTIYTVTDIINRRKAWIKTCLTCKREYDLRESDSECNYTFCSMECNFGDLMERMMKFPGMTLPMATEVVCRDPKYAKFAGKSGSS